MKRAQPSKIAADVLLAVACASNAENRHGNDRAIGAPVKPKKQLAAKNTRARVLTGEQSTAATAIVATGMRRVRAAAVSRWAW